MRQFNRIIVIMLIVIFLLALALLFFLILKVKLEPFLSLIGVAFVTALAIGIPVMYVTGVVTGGFGSTLAGA